MFDTKIAIIVRENLAMWQKLNITAFLMSGITGKDGDIIGEPYFDKSGQRHLPISVQPIIVLSADSATLAKIRARANERGVETAAYIEEMFSTGFDSANREAFSNFDTEDQNTVGLAMRADKKIVDKITKGARMHE